MKIVSWNVNGLRSVYRKGLLRQLRVMDADIVCLQEIKAHKGDIPDDLLNHKGYSSYLTLANKKGYSGVMIFSRKTPLKVEHKLGLDRFDQEGRFLKLEYPSFILINIYMPHGSRDKKNLRYKLNAYKYFLKYLHKIKNKKIIICGDFNIAHQEFDLARPESNHNNVMFTLAERKQISDLIDTGLVDTFRKFNQEGENYTWWPYFANARQRNLGWRIDYIFVSKKLTGRLKDSFINNNVFGSDHCPVGINLK